MKWNHVSSLFLYILFSIFIVSVQAQEGRHKISGMVRNQKGEPVEAVSVVIKGAQSGTSTGIDGRFELQTNKSQVNIEYSRTGYQTLVMPLDLTKETSTDLSVILQTNITELESVKVIGNILNNDAVQYLGDTHQGYLLAGKKNEVLNISNADANIALKTGRQLFAKSPGIFVYDMDGSGNQVNISTRGLDPHRSWEFNIRRDGILTNSDMYGYPASHYNPPMESIEKVELIRGTAALQYGAQFGGLLNYVTKKPDSGRVIGFENLTTIGSQGLFSTYNAIGGSAGKWTYYAYLGRRYYNGYRKNGDSRAGGELLSLEYTPNRKLKFKTEFGHSIYRYHLPGPLSDSMFYADPRQSTRARNYYSPDIFVPSVTMEWNRNRNFTLLLTGSAVLGSRNSVQFTGFSDRKDTINPLTLTYAPRQVDIDHFNSYTAELKIKQEYRVFGRRSILSLGSQLMMNNMHRSQQGVGTTGTDYDLTLTEPGWGRDMHFKTHNLAIFAENLLYLTPSFTISPGFRYEDGQTHMTGEVVYYDPDKFPLAIEHHIPLLGISTQFRFNNSHRFYAGFSQAYRPMIMKDVVPSSTYEVIDPNLKDSYGYNLEAGFRGEWEGWLSYDVTIYHITYKNRIGNIILEDEQGNDYSYKTNLGDSRNQGVELYLEAFPVKPGRAFAFSVFTSSAWLHARYTRGTVVVNNQNINIAGNRVESAPEWTTRNGIHLVAYGISTSLQYSHVSRTYSDPLNSETPTPNGSKGPVPGYGLWDLNFSTRILKNYQLRFGINNFTNKQYFTKRPTFYPDPGIWSSDGRSWYLSFGFKL